MKLQIIITRKEGDPLTFRVPEDKLDLRVAGEWLIINEKTGKFDNIPVPGGPGGMAKVEQANTIAVIPAWNVLGVEVKKPEGFTTA